MSLFHLLAALLRAWYWIVAAALGLGLLAGTLALMKPRTWTTQIAFMPEGGESRLSSLSAIAGQFNLQVPGQSAGASPQLYVELLRSRTILEPLVHDSFRVSSRPGEPAGAADLATLLGLENGERRYREEGVRQWLRRAVVPSVSREAGIVRVRVTAPDPELANAVGSRVLERLHDFNRNSRRTKAVAERSFIEDRLEEVEHQLAGTEAELQRFLERNREYRNSPQLAVERERLERRLMLDQQRVVSMREALYEARLAEARDMPLITVIEAPHVPTIPDSRGVARQAVLGALFGAILAAFAAAAAEAFRRSGGSAPDAAEGREELSRAWRRLRSGLRLRRSTVRT